MSGLSKRHGACVISVVLADGWTGTALLAFARRLGQA
jgi:glutamyl/glutaminyl-tRNA synthetase